MKDTSLEGVRYFRCELDVCLFSGTKECRHSVESRQKTVGTEVTATSPLAPSSEALVTISVVTQQDLYTVWFVAGIPQN